MTDQKCDRCEGLRVVPKDVNGVETWVGCPKCDPTGEYLKAAIDPTVPRAAADNIH